MSEQIVPDANKAPEIVMSASEEAATRQTVTGWVSRLGNFWGADERMARYDGCTHHLCDCGATITKHDLKCKVCRNAAEIERYNAMPQAAWDGIEPLYSDAHDRYFFCNDELADFIHEHGGGITSLRFIICQPIHATPLDHDHWCDDLPEDGEMPEALAAAIDALNAVVATLEPLAYEPSKDAATVESVGAVVAAAIARVTQC